MPDALGIDFGTEFCRLAAIDPVGRIVLLASPQTQDRKTPCAIGFRDEWLWGWSAANQSADTVWDLKLTLSDETDGKSLFTVRDRPYGGQDLIREFFRQLRQHMLEDQRGVAALPAVITVPYSLSLASRQLLRITLENAGFSIRGLINDAEAALLGYRVERQVNHGRCAKAVVFDVGATKTAISIMEVSWDDERLCTDLIAYEEGPGLRQVHTSLAHQIGLACGPEKRPAIMDPDFSCAFLQAAANGEDVAYEADGKSLQLAVTQVKTHIADWAVEADQALSNALSKAGLQARDIELAAPAGGGCEIPQIRKLLSHFSIVLEPPGGCTTEGVVARGAAKYAHILTVSSSDLEYRSAEVPAIGFELQDGRFHPVLGINHPDGGRDFRVYSSGDTQAEVLRMQPQVGFARTAASNVRVGEPIEIRLNPTDNLVKATIERKGDKTAELQLKYAGKPISREIQLG